VDGSKLAAWPGSGAPRRRGRWAACAPRAGAAAAPFAQHGCSV